MIKNYFKIALRHLQKNRGFSGLNILGLAIGMASSILILLWIQDEVNYNHYHKKYNTLVQVYENQTYDGKTYTFSATPGLLASAMKSEMPEIVNTTRAGWEIANCLL